MKRKSKEGAYLKRGGEARVTDDVTRTKRLIVSRWSSKHVKPSTTRRIKTHRKEEKKKDIVKREAIYQGSL